MIDLLATGLPAGVLRFGARCEELGQTADLAWVKLVTGEILEADAVVGADGIHSLVRERLWGHKPAQAANILMWRALIPGDRLSSVDLPERGHNWTGPGRTIVRCPHDALTTVIARIEEFGLELLDVRLVAEHPAEGGDSSPDG